MPRSLLVSVVLSGALGIVLPAAPALAGGVRASYQPDQPSGAPFPSDRFTVLRDGRGVATGEIAGVTDDELIAKMVGRAQQTLFPSRSSRPGETILEVDNLASPPLLKNASFTLSGVPLLPASEVSRPSLSSVAVAI